MAAAPSLSQISAGRPDRVSHESIKMMKTGFITDASRGFGTRLPNGNRNSHLHSRRY